MTFCLSLCGVFAGKGIWIDTGHQVWWKPCNLSQTRKWWLAHAHAYTEAHHLHNTSEVSLWFNLSLITVAFLMNKLPNLDIAVYPKNFHDSSDICPMGFIYFIQICEISHRTFGPRHRKCPICPMIFMNTDIGYLFNTLRLRQMTAIFQTIFSNGFSWMKMYEFRLRFHWRLLLRF